MKSTHQWHRALAEAGYNGDGSPKNFPLSSVVKDRRKFLSRFFFFWPFVMVVSLVYILSHMVIYAAVPVALFVAYSLQSVASLLLKWAPSDMKHIHRTVRFTRRLLQRLLISSIAFSSWCLCRYSVLGRNTVGN